MLRDLFLGLIGTLLLAQPSVAAPGYVINEIVRYGDPTPLGDTFWAPEAPILSNAGKIAFRDARCIACPFGQERRVWLYDIASETFEPVALNEEVLSATESIFTPYLIGLSDSGTVVIYAGLWDSTTGIHDALLSWTAGELVVLIRSGDSSPWGPILGVSDAVGANRLGEVAFAGSYGTIETKGIFRFDETGLHLVVKSGDPAPGTGGGIFQSFVGGLGKLYLNNAGDIAFVAQVVGGTTDAGVFMARGSNLIKIAANGEPKPTGGVFGGGWGTSVGGVNDQGQVIVNDDSDIFRWDPVVGLTTEVVANSPTGFGCVGSFNHDYSPTAAFGINEAGEIAGTTGYFGTEIFARRQGALQSVASTCEVSGIGIWAGTGSLNDPGDVAFYNYGSNDVPPNIYLAKRNIDCADGIDNDLDSLADLQDPGCNDSSDISEISPDLLCDDGRENDGDGMVDARTPGCSCQPGAICACPFGPEDPGCRAPDWPRENPQCQDGINNDGDGLIDFDGGQSIHGTCSDGVCPSGVSDRNADGVADPDPQCVAAWRDKEKKCGLGFELVFVLLPLLWFRRTRYHRTAHC